MNAAVTPEDFASDAVESGKSDSVSYLKFLRFSFLRRLLVGLIYYLFKRTLI
jgi:hypothetical protein